MSNENLNPVAKPRRRKPINNNVKKNNDSENEIEKINNDEKILEDLRQSIEKTDDSNTIANNLFNPDVPDKMAHKRSSKRRPKKGEDNLSFEPENDVTSPQVTDHNDKTEPEKSRTRRRRPHKADEVETNNEELSKPDRIEEGNENEDAEKGDAKAHRKRRIRKKDRNESIEMDQTPATSTSGENEREVIRNIMDIEDDGNIISVMIHRTDRLKTDINAVHPMIRVHIIDISSEKLMMKQHKDRKVISFNEDVEKVTMILPMMTQPFDFKSRRLTIPAWEEALIFNENANYLTKNPNAIFLFEVVDLNNSYSINKSYYVQQQSSGLHHIAWGFLLPVGANGTYNINKRVRLQLYENGPLHGNNNPYSANVFSWWKNGLRKAYPSTLYVTISAIRLNPQTSSEPTLRSMFPNQMEGSLNGLGNTKFPGPGTIGQQTFSTMQQWKRLPGQMCHIPNTLQFKLVTSAGGTSTVAFSPDGEWLACGSIDSSDNFPILVYSMSVIGSQQPSLRLTGHSGIVYSIAWCPKSHVFATGSADGTVRLWNMAQKKLPKNNETYSETNSQQDTSLEDTSTVNDEVRIGEKRVLCHPCFVYCVLFHPRSSFILVTAGYDTVIRIWDVANNRNNILQQLDLHKGYINSIIFSTDGQNMYSADSIGIIHVWKTPIMELNKTNPYKDKWSRGDIIEERDLHGVVINHIMLTTTGKRLMVHGRDGNIRLMDLKIKAMVLKFHGIINTVKNIHSCLSPCGSFLFSGTEDNSEGSQVFVWNALTGDHIAIFKDLNLPGIVNSIDYHPKCHMLAFSALGSEGSILLYTYSPEKAKLDMGYQSGNSSPNSPRLSTHHPQINYDNMTKLEETKSSRRFETDESGFNSFQQDYDKKQTDRLSRILNTLNSVTEVSQTLRRANHSLDRDMSFKKTMSNDGYSSGAEEKGRLMRSNKKASNLQSIPMSLNATSAFKANFTFKPPPAVKHKELSSKYLGEVIAIYDYDGQRADELSFVRGEVIKVVFRDGKNWLLGESSDGTQGYLPTNYVTGDENLAKAPLEDESILLKSEPRKARFKNSDEVVDFKSTDPTMNTSLKSSRKQRRRPSLQSQDDT